MNIGICKRMVFVKNKYAQQGRNRTESNVPIGKIPVFNLITALTTNAVQRQKNFSFLPISH
jgi:hypothetical protein